MILVNPVQSEKNAMNPKKAIITRLLIILLALLLSAAALVLYIPHAPYGFAREVSSREAELRLSLVDTAAQWLGANEADGSHHTIIDLYNSHTPLAQNYTVTYEDNWCAAFGSAAAIEAGLTDIIPTECGCERQILLFRELGRWQEQDDYLPLPGDYIYYAWDDVLIGDCTGWADHVGIVAGTWGPFIKVIEGNTNDTVAYRYILCWDPTVRGYGLPDYSAECE